jgi:hypothetical protein
MTAPIWVEAQSIELPATKLGVLGQQLPGGISRSAARQSEDEVRVLGHYVHYGGTCDPLHRNVRKCARRNETTTLHR